MQGIAPVPLEERTDRRWYQMFFVWFSANMNILAFSTGSSGPAFFSLGLVDSVIILIVVDCICCIVPAYMAVFGPKLGTRSMVLSRFSWGHVLIKSHICDYYGAILPSVLNVFSMIGFLILNCIIGGQTLASVSSRLDDTLGIVIISIISLAVVFFGYRVLHLFESIAWIPSVIAFILMLGLNGKTLIQVQSYQAPRPSPATVISFASTIASSILSWCTMTADYGVFHSPDASAFRLFMYSYLGFLVPSLTGHIIGAAFAAGAAFVPAWQEAFGNGNNVGGLIYATLSPAGGFGAFMTVVVSLFSSTACAITMYTFATSFMTVSPLFARLPQWVYVFISEAILIPVAIVGANKFYTTFVDVISIIGYWTIIYFAIVCTEHVIFRRSSFSTYNVSEWDIPSRLPTGIAAVVSFLCGIGIVIPCMKQAWYEGPIARAGTGDIGLYTSFVLTIVVYAVSATLIVCYQNCAIM
ncbi:hypothetical protein SERLADRAFT_359352 [Serpula lacrymans var. lacrymans S7.9]|uniref:Purine-cytosine permease n=1 Tax=Serpula lacrymans var. lacrymans (strain S7.9) TaxID=578457 RepID=F8NHM4_SERL9|nr:uncharacterized protein SERLADRAFT_359352 [Serpula lacrymans var. lacrymans S7.9]EGO29194.1 hypothetical protein SERLADRAFT_359352 [Serpula lacrymans var. lacrymans S7.9]